MCSRLAENSSCQSNYESSNYYRPPDCRRHSSVDISNTLGCRVPATVEENLTRGPAVSDDNPLVGFKSGELKHLGPLHPLSVADVNSENKNLGNLNRGDSIKFDMTRTNISKWKYSSKSCKSKSEISSSMNKNRVKHSNSVKLEYVSRPNYSMKNKHAVLNPLDLLKPFQGSPCRENLKSSKMNGSDSYANGSLSLSHSDNILNSLHVYSKSTPNVQDVNSDTVNDSRVKYQFESSSIPLRSYSNPHTPTRERHLSRLKLVSECENIPKSSPMYSGYEPSKAHDITCSLARQNDASPTHEDIYSRESRKVRSSHLEKSILAKKRVVKMLFVVVFEFFVCWTPIFIINILALYIPKELYSTLGGFGISFFHLLSYTSACCNPITYCFMNRRFVQALLNVFGCRKPAVRQPKIYGSRLSYRTPSNIPLRRMGNYKKDSEEVSQ